MSSLLLRGLLPFVLAGITKSRKNLFCWFFCFLHLFLKFVYVKERKKWTQNYFFLNKVTKRDVLAKEKKIQFFYECLAIFDFLGKWLLIVYACGRLRLRTFEPVGIFFLELLHHVNYSSLKEDPSIKKFNFFTSVLRFSIFLENGS